MERLQIWSLVLTSLSSFFGGLQFKENWVYYNNSSSPRKERSQDSFRDWRTKGIKIDAIFRNISLDLRYLKSKKVLKTNDNAGIINITVWHSDMATSCLPYRRQKSKPPKNILSTLTASCVFKCIFLLYWIVAYFLYRWNFSFSLPL